MAKSESTFEQQKLFGKQLWKWRIRAGITAAEAGNRAFNVKSDDLINTASARRKWQRYEKGEFPNLNAAEIKNLSAAVGGNARLGAAILKNSFISWKDSEHERFSRSPTRKINDYFDEDGFENEVQMQRPQIVGSSRDADFYDEPAPKEKPKKKSKEQKEVESLLVTKEFLVNRRRKHEFKKGLAETSEYTRSGTSLEYMVNMEKFERDEDLEYERNSLVEKFFRKLIIFDEDLSFTAFQDLWLSFLSRNERGLELLQQIVQFYGGNSISNQENEQKFIHKYAAHYATNLLFHLYELAYDPLNPKSSADTLTEECLENYNVIREYAEQIKRVPEAIEGKEAQRKFLIDLFKSLLMYLPDKSRSRLRKDFSRVVFALAPQDDADDYLNTRDKRTQMKNDFKVTAMNCLSELYYLEREIYYLLNEEEQTKVKIKQPLFFKTEMREKHTLFRFYNTVAPQQFLECLWLLQDTFDLYNLKVEEIKNK